MVHTRELKRYVLIAAATLSVNMMLFTGLPNLLPKHAVIADVEQIQAVDFIRHHRGPESREEKNPSEKPKPPEPPRIVPKNPVKPLTRTTHQDLKLDAPAFKFDAPADVAMGVAVNAPETPPRTALNDFYGMQDVDQAPVATVKTQPVYPYRARRLNLDGEVDVKFLVDTGGRVSRIRILRAAPKGLFDDSVMRALSSWRFTPGKVEGRPVNTWVTTTIAFRMDDL